MANDLAILSDEKNIFQALKDIVYKGASDRGVALVMSYCKARKIDPMLKPVHIIKMKSKSSAGNWVEEDTIMPGIGLYRIQAARSGCMGISEPVFGEVIYDEVGSIKISYPISATVTVRKLLHTGQVAEFSATEFWLENYANKGSKYENGKKVGIDVTPNDMWAKRPFGQLAKCAEAQALRKAFPEVVDNLPTFEEKSQQVIVQKSFPKENKPIEQKTNPTENFYAPTIEEACIELKASQTLDELETNFKKIWKVPLLRQYQQQLIDVKDECKDFLSTLLKESQATTAVQKPSEDDEWIKAFDGETGEIK